MQWAPTWSRFCTPHPTERNLSSFSFSSFFPRDSPSSFFLTSVTSVTSRTLLVAELPSSFFPMTNDKIAVIVLAGGQSSRMGRDKALLEIEGKSLLQRALEVATVLTPEVYVLTACRIAIDRP